MIKMGLKDLFSKARVGIQRRVQKKVADWKEQQKRKREMIAKIRAAQRKAYYEELERAAVEQARRMARKKASQGLTIRERLVKLSQSTPTAANLLGFDITKAKKKKGGSPASIIMGKKEED